MINNPEFQNFIIPGIFKELSGTLEFPWKFPIFGQFQGIGYFSHSILSLELDFECRIPKFHHSWNLPGIMWNSRISLEVDYILPNLTYVVSIWPNVIILYTFGVSLNFWSLEFGDQKILQSPEFGSFSMWGIFPLSFCQGPWFSMQNSKGPLFLESSKNFFGD